MQSFEIQEQTTGSMSLSKQQTKELIQQIRALEKFYLHLGFDTKNTKTVFKLTLDYLEGKISVLEIRSFFDALMKNNKVMNEKELNLLTCFDHLIETHEESSGQSLDLKKTSKDDGFKNVA